jgi:CubicO group peptidase (beta-lactamase class C family)
MIGIALVAISVTAALRREEPAPREAVVAPSRPTPREITRPDSAGLSRAAERGARLPRLKSMIVSWKGEIALERYYHGATRTSPANIKSASKTVISALVGIAIARGEIGGVGRTLSELLPTETAALDSSKRAITVQDLVTMRAGLQSTSFENYGAWVSSRNWVRDALRRPVVSPRGDGGPMIYSTGNSHLLSATLTRVSRSSTHAYADRHLFRPLGIQLRGWTTDPQGIYFGGNEMRLTPREMLAFGTLYLNGGMAGSRQVIPREWIDSSWVPRTRSGWSGHEYGYGWWIRSARGYRVYFAWGYGGQFIFVIPELHAVVVTTSDSDVQRERGHNDEIHAILDQEIVPALGG